jgi:hypothetical protein
MSEVETVAAVAAPEPAAIAPAQTAEVAAPVEVAKSEPVNESNLEAAMTAVYEKRIEEQQPRENGKFASKDKPTPDQPPAQAVEPATPAIDRPQSWSPDDQAIWDSLTPAAQDKIAKRESESHKRISQFGEQFKAVQPLAQFAKQNADYFRSKGASPGQYMQYMTQLSQNFDANPHAVLEHLAQQKGIDLRAHYGQPGQQNDIVRSLQAEIAQARREAHEAKSAISQQAAVETDRSLKALVSKIEEFAKDKPDYAELESKMLAHVKAIRETEPDADAETLLAKSYEAARWADPERRAKLIAEERKAEEAKREAEAKKKAEEARRLGTLNVKSTAANPSRKGSWEDTLRSVGDRIAS